MTFRLPKFIVIRSNYYSDRGNVYYKEASAGGSVVLGEPSVFSTLAKIEVERAKSNDSYVHLRFSYSNRYWQREENGKFIVCVSTKPEEDTSKPSCTLFEPVEVPDSNGMFYLNHVQSGGRLLIEEPSMNFFVNLNPASDQGYLACVNWETLVKLPERVAFKGNNGMFLEVVIADNHPYLKFSSNDPNDGSSGHEVTLMPDGYLRIKSNKSGMFWRRSPDWIWADSSDTTAANKDTLFRPVKIDGNTIALSNEGNGCFCKRLTAEGHENCLNAAAGTITSEARLGVQEQVLQRSIYNVRYMMENARIFDETPFLAGSTTLINETDVESNQAAEITYENQSSYSFSRSLSLTAGVTSSISFGVPFITEGSIEVSFQISTDLTWEDTTTTTTSVTATGSVPVPPMSTAVISYVGTRGTCNIPFYYTQRDQRSTDGSIVETDRADGIYTGVNCYNFQFVVDKTVRLA